MSVMVLARTRVQFPASPLNVFGHNPVSPLKRGTKGVVNLAKRPKGQGFRYKDFRLWILEYRLQLNNFRVLHTNFVLFAIRKMIESVLIAIMAIIVVYLLLSSKKQQRRYLQSKQRAKDKAWRRLDQR